ncbi:MAG: hypothetical protein KAR22_06720, partial [Gammaproteobacteria bacterium]|nr:hypothetical protein [Gammaproteobacteria bacterium]
MFADTHNRAAGIPRLVKPIAAATMTAVLFACTSLAAYGAAPADWSKVPVTSIKLFYPGQSSYEWLHSKDHKRADKKVAQGDSCISCHEGEEQEIGELIVSGDRLEPMPVKGKQPTIDLALQFAYDKDNAYLRAQWKTRNPY